MPVAVSIHPKAVLDDPQVQHRNLLTTVRHSVAGPFVQVGIPLRLSVDVPAVKGPAPSPRPTKGRATRMKIDTGIGVNLRPFRHAHPEAELAGLDCLWAAETTNDPFLSLVLAAEHSKRRIHRYVYRHRISPAIR